LVEGELTFRVALSAPAAFGSKMTPMVQEAPAASELPVQVSLTMRKLSALAPVRVMTS